LFWGGWPVGGAPGGGVPVGGGLGGGAGTTSKVVVARRWPDPVTTTV
jgi:hypothetical protein